MDDLHPSVVFCDSVRQEVSGKLILLGTYGAVLGVGRPGQPFGLAAHVIITGQPREMPDGFSVHASLNGERIAGVVVAPADVRAGYETLAPLFSVAREQIAASGAGPVLLFGQTTVDLIVPPFEGTGLLTIEVDMGRGPRLAGALVLTPVPEDEPG